MPDRESNISMAGVTDAQRPPVINPPEIRPHLRNPNKVEGIRGKILKVGIAVGIAFGGLYVATRNNETNSEPGPTTPGGVVVPPTEPATNNPLTSFEASNLPTATQPTTEPPPTTRPTQAATPTTNPENTATPMPSAQETEQPKFLLEGELTPHLARNLEGWLDGTFKFDLLRDRFMEGNKQMKFGADVSGTRYYKFTSYLLGAQRLGPNNIIAFMGMEDALVDSEPTEQHRFFQAFRVGTNEGREPIYINVTKSNQIADTFAQRQAILPDEWFRRLNEGEYGQPSDGIPMFFANDHISTDFLPVIKKAVDLQIPFAEAFRKFALDARTQDHRTLEAPINLNKSPNDFTKIPSFFLGTMKLKA